MVNNRPLIIESLEENMFSFATVHGAENGLTDLTDGFLY